MFEHESFDDHERVIHVHDDASGLRAIIAIHSTALGPAGGGCRLWTYHNTAEALDDALRLSRGMSCKNALAGLNMGGGKAVILGPVPDERRRAVFEAFGDAVNALRGAYVTAEDVGVAVGDMQVVASRTDFVSGLSNACGAGGDPSPFTARGVCLAMEAVASRRLDASSLEGLSVAVQGLGGVGGNLCRELSERGARLVVADIDASRVEAVCDSHRAERSDVDAVLLSDVDMVAPCALGGALTEDVASKLRAKAVVGGANNQLATLKAGEILFDRQIAYAPDYLVNAGGIIMVAAEYFKTNAADRVDADIAKIYDRTVSVLDRSAASCTPTNIIADAMAYDIIGKARLENAERQSAKRRAVT